MTEQTSAHGATTYSPGACERCWSDAWLRSQATPESQVEAYRYLLAVRDGDPEQRAKCQVWKPEMTQAALDREARRVLSEQIGDGGEVSGDIPA